MSNLNEELSVRLVGKLTLLLPELEINLQKQIDVKKMIDNILYEYEVTTKCTSLSTSDIKEKARLYIACKKLEGLSDKTLRNYIGFLSWLDQYFNKPCSTITTMDLRMFLDYKSKGKMASTVNGYITYLKNFFTWLQDEEYITSNPARKLKSTKVPKLIKEAYKSESLEKMRDACESIRDKALFEVLESTACRISEISTIRLDKINWSEKSIKVLHILLAEDNELNMEIAECMLQKEGADVTKAWNGLEAVEIFRKSIDGEFDVILMDIMMPVMNGYEATKLIRSLDREDARKIPIVAMTANAFTEDRMRAKEAGMDEHISKPFDVKLLLKVIHKLTENRQKENA